MYKGSCREAVDSAAYANWRRLLSGLAMPYLEAIFCFVLSVAVQDAPQSDPIAISIERLGDTDPIAVIDDVVDMNFVVGRSLANLWQFEDVLDRLKLAAFVQSVDCDDPTRDALWSCACSEWPSFVEELARARPSQRDVLLAIAAKLAIGAGEGKPAELNDRSLQATLTIRVAAERVAVEIAFLNRIALCANDAMRATTVSGRSVNDVLEPLVLRAKIRNATEVMFGERHIRWTNLDLRNIVESQSWSRDTRASAEPSLLDFERLRAVKLPERMRANWRAVSWKTEVFERWNRVAVIEQSFRRATIEAVGRIAASVAVEGGARFRAECVRRAYPELHEISVAVETNFTSARVDHADDLAQLAEIESIESAWRSEHLVLCARAQEELNAHSDEEGLSGRYVADEVYTELLDSIRARSAVISDRHLLRLASVTGVVR